MLFNFLILIFSSLSAFAIVDAPNNFAYKSGKAVFVDFQKAEYEVVVDFKNKISRVVSKVEFYQTENGFPVFDIRTKIHQLKIDSKKSTASEVTPPGAETNLRVLNLKLEKGLHVLEVESDIAEFAGGIDFKSNSLDLDMSLSDLLDREFFEIWAVSNLEYDQFSSVFELTILNSKTDHQIYHNGMMLEHKPNYFKLVFPEYFNTSAVYIHIAPVKSYREKSFEIQSTSGLKIPVMIYTMENLAEDDILDRAAAETIKVIQELENKIAPWPHPRLLIQIFEGPGGMEYHGATSSGIEDLRHELIHSYFARGVMPLDGNSSWIDEAITEWITHRYDSVILPCDNATDCSLKLNELPPYIRHTTVFYPHGEAFIAYLDNKFKSEGGMLPFLSWFFLKYKFTTISTEILKSELESFFRADLTSDFQTYIFN
jgi:hypothetical protein